MGGSFHQRLGAGSVPLLQSISWEGLLLNVPLSRVFTFTDGSVYVKVQCGDTGGGPYQRRG